MSLACVAACDAYAAVGAAKTVFTCTSGPPPRPSPPPPPPCLFWSTSTVGRSCLAAGSSRIRLRLPCMQAPVQAASWCLSTTGSMYLDGLLLQRCRRIAVRWAITVCVPACTRQNASRASTTTTPPLPSSITRPPPHAQPLVFPPPPPSIPSATGLRDQQAALQWVRDNIATFGGDPRRVTVAGQSSGGTSILALYCSPRSRGLFDGAVSLSGSINIMMGLQQAFEQNEAVLHALNCSGGVRRASCSVGVVDV